MSSSRISRRRVLKTMGAGASAGLAGLAGSATAEWADRYRSATRGESVPRITRVRAIPTAPHGIELVVVRVETDQPGLYGVGCATFRQRARAVVTAVDEYLDHFCRDRRVDQIENIWQSAYVSSYWRNGPVLNNALSGLDQALWDIKGKQAGMPVYQLLGGKCRFAPDCYSHASGSSIAEVVDDVHRLMEEGFRHVRIQLGGYGSGHLSREAAFREAGFGRPEDTFMDPDPYLRATPEMFDRVRTECGEDVELLHDIHERVQPVDAIDMIKRLEPYRPFFIEDPFSPENNEYFERLRTQTSVPIAMGELYNNPHEWIEPMSERWIDFIRIHVSQIGGITPAMKVARFGEVYNVRTAWHGPADVSPVGHAANAHIDLAVWNFGIQEAVSFSDRLRRIFPGTPTVEDGFMHVNEAPGLGVDVDEEEAARYPLPEHHDYAWTQVRRDDGTPVRP